MYVYGFFIYKVYHTGVLKMREKSADLWKIVAPAIYTHAATVVQFIKHRGNNGLLH